MILRPRSPRALPAVVAALIVLSGCGDSNDSGSSSETSSAGVSLQPPTGWEVVTNGDQGLAVAQNKSDLSSDAPQGPRLIARPAAGDSLGTDAALDSVAPAEGSRVISDPGRTRVDGHRAVSVLVRESRGGQPTVSGTVVVALGPGRAYLFSLEAPANNWTATKRELFNILSTVKFDLAAVP